MLHLQIGCKVMLTGQAWSNNMYVCLMSEHETEEERRSVDKESLLPTCLPPGPEDTTPPPPQPLLLMFIHKGGADLPPTRRGLEIGCVKSSLVKKTTGDFTIDAQTASNPFAKCFTFDTVKVGLDMACV